jgi:hypothetical protein
MVPEIILSGMGPMNRLGVVCMRAHGAKPLPSPLVSLRWSWEVEVPATSLALGLSEKARDVHGRADAGVDID